MSLASSRKPAPVIPWATILLILCLSDQELPAGRADLSLKGILSKAFAYSRNPVKKQHELSTYYVLHRFYRI